MKLKSPADKGHEYERELIRQIRAAGLGDDKTRRTIMSGAVFEDGDIKTALPFCFEAKRTERFKLYEFWDQARNENLSYHKIPILVTRQNNRESLVILDWQDFLALVTYALKGGYAKDNA